MPWLPLWAGSVSGTAWRLLPAGADGYGREHCPGGLQEHEAGQTETAGVEGPGPGLSDLGGGNPQSVRRRGPAPEAGQRNREKPVRLRFCL